MGPKYEKCHKLGEGTYASVYMARDIATDGYVALKEVTIDPEEGTPSTAIREIAYVKSLKNLPNVVRLLDVIYSETKITLVLELCKQDLKRFMDSFKIPSVGNLAPTPQPLPNSIAKDMAYQLLCGVQSLHENRIIHRDLKPQNILLTDNNILKIGDFGLARSFGPPTSTYSNEVVTLWYRAPDVLLGSKSYSMPIDIWSVGCIVAEFFLGYPLFRGRDNTDQLLTILKVMGTPDARALDKIIRQAPEIPRTIAVPYYPKIPLAQIIKKAPPKAINLLENLLEIDPMRRISAADALNHAYFQGYDR